MDDEVAGNAESGSGENGLLAVERKVVDVFADEQVGKQARGGKPADERSGGRGGDDGRKVAAGLATEFRAHDATLDISGRNDVQQFGDFLAAALEGFGIGGDKVGDDLGGLDGQAVEAGDAAAVATSLLGAAHGLRSGGGLLRCVRAAGGWLFSRRQVLEEYLELGGINLLALVAEKAADEVVELLL